MELYTPYYAPEIDLFYKILSPGQEQTFDQQYYPPEIEIMEVEIHSETISEELTDILLDAHEEQWREEILISLKKERV